MRSDRSTVTVAGLLLAGTGAVLLLAHLQPPPVESSAPRAKATAGGYSRAQFGAGWADPDGNGCNAREDALRRDLRNREGAGCRVTAGTFANPYTGKTSSVQTRTLDVDHVVPLAEAWRTGAAGWTRDRRVAFANDPDELVVADAHSNRSKGDRTIATWQPASRRLACAYDRRYLAVKVHYSLTISADERDAERRACGGT